MVGKSQRQSAPDWQWACPPARAEGSSATTLSLQDLREGHQVTGMKINIPVRSRLKHLFIAPVLYLNYRMGNYRDVVWLIGDGRSGTTWVSSLINHAGQYREMFEPFHPALVRPMRQFAMHEYMRPGVANPRLLAAAEQVFTGRLLHHRVDKYNRALRYRGLLVKDIFANLFACWASRHFPSVKVVLLLRNPFAVARSKLVKKAWAWSTDPEQLLTQPTLYEDHLQPFEDLIRETSRTGDPVLRTILVWAIINSIPLRQFRPGEIDILFYEEVLERPGEAVGGLLGRIHAPARQQPVSIPRRLINRPSRVAGRDSTLRTGRSPVAAWRHELTTRQIDAGHAILDRFGLAALYGEDSRPDRAVLNNLLNQA